MYKCDRCGNVFSEGVTWYEPAGWKNGGCPHCRSDDCFEVYPCEICGNCDDMLEGEDYCESCKKAVTNKLQSWMDEALTDKEKQLLRALDEDCSLEEWCRF